MKENQNSKGITLIALIVTIIVLLILAGVEIAMLTGENSIITKAIQAKEATSEAEAKERVELEVLGSVDRKGQIDKEKLKENLRDNLGVQDNQIVDPNEEDEFNDPFDFPLGDYDVEVKPDGEVEVLPKGEIPTPPQLQEGDITFTAVPSTLTNKEVKVTIKAKVSTMRLTLQYATEEPNSDDNWQTYTGPVTFKDNGPIYARLINENGEKSNYTTGNINNIDKEGPAIEEFKVVGAITSNSVKVTVNANDDRQLASKDTYKFFTKEIAPVAASLEEDAKANGYKLNGTSTESEYTYTNLEQGKSYTLKVIVTDEAGNTAEKEIENQVEVQKVPDLVASADPEASEDPSQPDLPKTPNITFNYEPKGWTQEDVTVTLETAYTEQGYILQYSLTGKEDSWQDYKPEGFTVTQNQAVFARLRDSSNQYGGTATGNVSNIDREIPSLRINVGNTTTKTIEVNLTTEDKPSGLAESEAIKYYIVEGRITNQATLETKKGDAKETSNNKSYTFSGLKQNTTYTILVEVTDKAKNINKKSIITSTGSIPGTKPVPPGSADTDGDGRIDAWDTDGDGTVDAWDTDGDGNADSWDDNGNGQLDEPAENNFKNGNNGRNKDGGKDTNGDGLPDTWDTNHDGKDDSWDTNKDGNADSYDRNGDGLLNDDENNSKHPEELKERDQNGGKDTNRDGKPDTWDTDGDDKDDSFDTDKDGNADSYDQNGNGELDDSEDNSKHPNELKGRDQNGGKDTNGDGKPDSWDITGDNKDDSWDTDGDGNADSWDRNKNNNLDESENNLLRPELNGRDENGGRDTNKDGRPDTWDTDGDGKDDAKDNNGDLIPDEWDTDGDGKPDSWDTDVPPDGNADSFDRDGNNKLDEGEDNSKHPELEGKDETGGRDTNGDGKADTWDKDENGNKAWDNDGDGKSDAWDTDGDGNADSFDRNGNNELDDNEDNSKHSDTLHGRDENGGKDNNGDGKPDSWDITGDDKDDSWDTDGDGNADSWDRNKNNTLDNNENNSKHPELNGRDENGGRDTNKDGRPDVWDRDGDGKDDAWDTDVPPDGNADSFDKNGNGKLDDDEDNSKHSEELNGRDENGGKDTNGDGKSDTWDRDGDGKDDAKDTDGDGNADSFDKDHNGEIDESEDNSKHPDELKGRDENNGKDTNQDGKPDTWDRDGDGRDDAWDTDVPPDGNADSYDRNNNGRLDDNENNSLHPDELKGRDENGGKDTNQDGKPDTWDTDGDGKDDAWDITDDEGNKNPDGNADSYDRDGDGELDDNEDNSKHSEELKGRDENHGKDTNGDGKPDLWDRDDNGEDDSQDTDKDGNADKWLDPDTKDWKDEDESGYRAWDTNKDGKPDSWDTNKDGDADSYDKNENNKLDPDENSTTNPSEENNGRDKNGGRDTNGDGKPDAWDTNGDGKDDSWDTDKDGNADSYDKDKDNNLDDDENNSLHPDTLKGRDENGGKDTNGDGKPDTWDTDDDGKDDSWDTSDEDGNPNPDGKADSYDKNGNGVLDDDENNSKHPDELKGRDQNGGKDTNGDGKPDTWDRDGDGRDDSWDKDGDGNADTYDRNWNGELEDSEDNSKHPEELKGRDENGGRDTNKDGRPDSWDTDGDNKDDAWDTDGDGDPDAWDTDEPKDGNADEWVFPSEEGTITFTYRPETWTNTPVEIILDSDYTPEFSIEYSKNYNPVTRQGSWEAGTKTSLDDNGKIYAHLKDDETGETGGVVRGEVNYIDKTNPTVETKTSDITTNSATLNVTASDAQSGLAKEDTYKYYLIDGEVSDLEQVKDRKGSAKETSTNASYKFTKLKENEKYTLVVDVSDEVGNVTTDFKTVQITKIPDLDQAEITFNYSNDDWNNEEKIHVTISTGEDVDTKNYDLQYQTPEEENKDWQNYTDAGFDITKNGSIFARLKEKDGDQGGKTATSTYSKFDRDDPTVSLEVGNRTTSSIQVTATGSDGEGSGIQKYEFYQGEEVKHTETTEDTSATYTFDSLTPGEAYSLKVVITDNVGRTGEDTANADETKTVPDLNQEGSINFEYTPTDGNWTNDKVNVKVTSKYTDEYKIEYSTEEPENWQEYTGNGFNVEEENGKFKVRLKQQTGELTTDAIEKEITWIDKTDPELSIKDEPQVSTNSIAVEVTAEDSLSQLKAGTPISYYLIEGEVADADQIQAQKGEAKESSIATSYTYTNLTQGQKYTVVIEATDNANNTATVSRVLTTGQVPGLDQSEDLTVTYSNTEWNNQENVHVTLTPKTPVDVAFKLEYKVDYTSPRPETDTNVPWTEYLESGFDITNNATITARITEKEGTQSGATATSTYSKFDREEPELSEISVTKFTTNSISVSVTATDKPDQGASGLLEENAYTYIIDQTANVEKEPSETQQSVSSNENTHTFTGLTHNTDYTIKVMVADKAQNIANKETTQTTEKIPDLSQDGAITFDVTPSGWTNKEQATVKLNTKTPVDETKFKLQYQTPNEENTDWQDYDKEAGFTITKKRKYICKTNRKRRKTNRNICNIQLQFL